MIAENWESTRSEIKRIAQTGVDHEKVVGQEDSSIVAWFRNRFMKSNITNPRRLTNDLQTNSVWVSMANNGSMSRLDFFLKANDPELFEEIYPARPAKTFDTIDLDTASIISFNCSSKRELTLPLNSKLELEGINFYGAGNKLIETEGVSVRVGIFGSIILTPPLGAVRLEYAVTSWRNMEQIDYPSIHKNLRLILPVCQVYKDPMQKEFEQQLQSCPKKEVIWLQAQLALGFVYCNNNIISKWLAQTGGFMADAVYGSRVIICDSGAHYIASAATSLGFPCLVLSGPNLDQDPESSKAKFKYPGHSINLILHKQHAEEIDVWKNCHKLDLSFARQLTIYKNPRVKQIYQELKQAQTAEQIHNLAEEFGFIISETERPWVNYRKATDSNICSYSEVTRDLRSDTYLDFEYKGEGKCHMRAAHQTTKNLLAD